MKISIFGLGYVGCVSIGCFAEMGHKITGVDISQNKVDLVNSGNATIQEAKINELIAKHVISGRVRATVDAREAILESEISFLCIGTPSTATGHLNLDGIFSVCEEIGDTLKEKEDFHIVVIRSTVPPGTNAKVVNVIEAHSGKKADGNFGVVSNPEFLREGSAVDDFFDPELIVLGSESPRALEKMKAIYLNMSAHVFECTVTSAELIKYINNSFHALKVSFANEIGRICHAIGTNPFEVMDIFLADSKLNTSKAYLKPGFAYGGSCLPKDLKALNTLAHDLYVDTPVLAAVETSNRIHIEKAVAAVEASGERKIGVYGLTFKPGTDDLRNSPIVLLVEKLLGSGYDIRIYDPDLELSRLVGRNKEYIEKILPHLSRLLLSSPLELLPHARLLIIANERAVEDLFQQDREQWKGKRILDLARFSEAPDGAEYSGLCW